MDLEAKINKENISSKYIKCILQDVSQDLENGEWIHSSNFFFSWFFLFLFLILAKTLKKLLSLSATL